MFPLAFVSGWLQGHWWGFISRDYVLWPTFFLMNVFIALKGSHFWFYIEISDLKTRDIILSRQRIAKALIRLRGCAGWSAPLMFAYGKNRFSHDVAQIKTSISRKLVGSMSFFYLLTIFNSMWAATWQNQQNECAPSEDSDQPGHPPSLIKVFAVRIMKAWVLSYPLSA